MSKKALAPSASVTHRDPKGLKFISIVEAAYNKAGLNEEEAQRVNDTPGLADLIAEFIVENRLTDKYKDEEARSKFWYLSGYKKPAAIDAQIDTLRSYWPKLNPDAAMRYFREVYPKLQLPDWVESPFAIIRPGFFSDAYGEEVEEIFKALTKSRDGKFKNYWEGQLGPEYLRRHAQTAAKLEEVVQQQPNSDVLILPGQFGIRHRGRSVRRAREVFTPSEFGVGAKDGGTMLLTNPVRPQHYDDLWLDMAGDEFAPGADGDFCRAPYFLFGDGQLEFDSSRVSSASEDYGSASLVLPQ